MSLSVPFEKLAALDRERLFHPMTALADHQARGPQVMVEGKGIRVRDAAGRGYLDAMAGLWCVNAGYGRSEIVEAIAAQAARLPFFHSFAGMANEPSILLAARLVARMPGEMSHVFFANSGSEANETQIKLIRAYQNLRGKPRKKKILARRRAYHGVTLGAASASGLPHIHGAFDLPLPGFLHLTPPHHWSEARDGESERAFAERLVRELDETIRAEDPETVAAFFAEPVMGAGGVLVPPDGYFEGVQEVLRRHDVLLVADEVICGFGRLGEWFGSQRFAIEPDLITVAKGLTSGYVPMSAAVVSRRVWEVIARESKGVFGHGFTYSAHPVAAAAGLANLDVIEREDLVGNARSAGSYLQMSLRETFGGHPLVGEVRGVGLIAAVELVAERARKRPFAADARVGPRLMEIASEEGLLVRALGNAVAVSPPLVIRESEIDELVERLRRALERLAHALVAEGTWKPA